MLRIRFEVICIKTNPLAAALNDLVIDRRGGEITDVIAQAAVVRVIRCQRAREYSVHRAAAMEWRALKLTTASSTVLYQ
jgi:hypothetical protein